MADCYLTVPMGRTRRDLGLEKLPPGQTYEG